MSEEHTGSTEVGNGADTNTAATAAASPDWQGFMAGFDRLNDTLKSELGGKLDALTHTVQSAAEPPPSSPPNFEEMSNSELVNHMMTSLTERMQQSVQEALTPLMEQFGGLQKTVATNAIATEMKELTTAHKDFKDWKPEMIERVEPVFAAHRRETGRGKARPENLGCSLANPVEIRLP